MPRPAIALMIMLAWCEPTSAQDLDELKSKCEETIVESLDAGNPTLAMISRCRLISFDRAKPFLVTSLASEDPNIVLAAGQALADESLDEFGDSVKHRLNQLPSDQQEVEIRKTGLLSRLGDEAARKQLDKWLDNVKGHIRLTVPGFAASDWICPMMCVEPAAKAGRCPVCGMELVALADASPSPRELQLQVTVLEELQKCGQEIARQARGIVASDADALTRVLAAGLWLREDHTGALPHAKLFLHSQHRRLAIFLLAEEAPRESAADLEQLLEGQLTQVEKLDVWRGLIRAGNDSFLDDVRRSVRMVPQSDKQFGEKVHAIYVLAENGTREDLADLAKLLGTEFKVFAAAAMLDSIQDADNE